MAERIQPTETQAPAPTAHPYNDPDLSPIEFLTAVYHATHLPMVTRIQAASALLPYTHPAPRPTVQGYVPYRCKIIIGGLGPCDPAQGSAGDPTGNHSQNRVSPNTTITRDGEAGDPVNLTTIPYPQSLPDYSTPPTPAEIQEIKAAVHALQPDFDPSQPVPLYLCACGHWLTFQCDCATRTRH